MNTNNINLDGIYSFEKEIYDDLSNARINTSISGEWNLKHEVGQFLSFVETEYGDAIMLADNTSATGGYGVQPSPFQYILFGIAASYASFLSRKATLDNLVLNKLVVKIETNINYEHFFSIEEAAPISRINILVDILTDEDESEILSLKELPYDCCPALYILHKSIQTSIEFRIKKSSDLFTE